MRAGVVDAFCDEAFGGNPAAVVLLEAGDGRSAEAGPSRFDPGDRACQALAAEFNLAETAFLRPLGQDRFALRWFTPAREVPLCGHATLAAAHWLWEAGVARGEHVVFETASGPLAAVREADAVRLDFPIVPVTDNESVPGLLDALGIAGTCIGRTGTAGDSARNALVVTDAHLLRTLRPDFAALKTLPLGGTIVSAAGDIPGVAVISRYFAPSLGIDEDPVTGSAHCTLADHWGRTLGLAAFRARQVSRRGGTVDVAVRGERVWLTGRAVTVLDVTVRSTVWPTGPG